MFRLLSLCLAFIIGYAACKQPNSRQHFSFNPEATVLYRVAVSRQTDQQWEYKGKLQHVTDLRQTVFNFQLLRKTDSAFLLKLQFVMFTVQNNMFKADTSDENPSPATVHNNPLLLYNYFLHFAKEQSITVWMDRKGRPVRVDGIAQLLDSIANRSHEPGFIVSRYLEDFISDAAIKDELNQLFCFIPDKPKSAGQSWVEDILLVAKAPVKWSTDFKMRYNKEDTTAIECHSYITARQGGDGRTYMKGKLAGSIVANYLTGIPYSWNAKSETITTTDSYDITTGQLLTATITAIKP